MGLARTHECDLIDACLREMYPAGGIQMDTQKDTHSEDYIVSVSAGDDIQPIRITIDEYADRENARWTNF